MKRSGYLLFGIFFLTVFVSLGFGQVPNIWINEFHYDNNSTDTGEFVEIVAPSSFADLANLTLSLYNGSNGTVYGTHTLDTFTSGETVNGFTIYYKDISGIQNGAPDGLAIDYSGTLIQLLSYEGVFTAADGPANGTESTDIGVSEAGTEDPGLSLQLTGAGTSYADFTWAGPIAETKGSINTGQTFEAGVDNPPAISGVTAAPVVPLSTENMTISATVTDDNGLSAVEIRYQINGSDPVSVTMTNTIDDTYTGEIPASAYETGYILEYWVYAEDTANQTTESNMVALFVGNVPISTVTVVDDQGVLNYGKYLARLTGVATVPDSTFQLGNLDVYMQDETAGINVFAPGAGSMDFIEGESYTVIGTIDQYNGKSEIIPLNAATDIIDNGFVGVPAPVVKTIAELLADPEAYEGMLVDIKQVSNTGGGDAWPSSGNANIEITDDGGTSLLTMRIDVDTDIDGQPEPTWPVDVIGIFSQFDNSSPYDAGYQLLPRSYEDFVAGAENPPAISGVTAAPVVPLASENMTVSATVTDDNGLSAVEIRYQINGSDPISVTMTNTSGDTYTGEIPASAYETGYILEYWVYAEDTANQTTESNVVALFVGNVPISTVTVVDDQGVLNYGKYLARLTGVATVPDSTFQLSNLDVYMQDETAGINVFAPGSGSMDFIEGESYTVIGTIDQYNGKSEIIPLDAATDIIDNGFVGTPVPVVKTIAELLTDPESYEGMLVGIKQVTNTGAGDAWPSSGNANVEITDDGGTSLLTMRIDVDTDIDGQPEPTWPVDVVGIFSQFDNSSPYDAGYQLLPRSYQDLNVVTSIAGETGSLPTKFSLLPNFPNPFNPETMITFEIPASVSKTAKVTFNIYNTLGQRVRTLYADNATPGIHKVRWNGTNDNGATLPSGIYFGILKADQFSSTIKMTLMK